MCSKKMCICLRACVCFLNAFYVLRVKSVAISRTKSGSALTYIHGLHSRRVTGVWSHDPVQVARNDLARLLRFG